MSAARAGRDERRRAPRAHFVDLLRLLMSAQMIQGHVVDALLAPQHRSGAFYEAWIWARGLTAVGFLVASGVSFHLSSVARWDAYRADSAARRRRVRRALMLIGIGYLLHFPMGALASDPEVARVSIDGALIVDVLQCVGATLLLLEALIRFLPSVRALVATCAALALAAIFAAPAFAHVECAGFARVACNYVTRSGGSLFPLVPWSGFVLAGVVVGHVALPEAAKTSGGYTAARLALMALVLVLASWGIEALVERPSDALGYAAAPSLSVQRLGCVVVVASLLAALSARAAALPWAVRALAGETLFLYVSHLLILYFGGIGLAHWLGGTLAPSAAIAVAAAIFVACASGAYGWARAKARAAR